MRKLIDKLIIPKSGKTSIVFLNTGEEEPYYSNLSKRDRHEDLTTYTWINVYVIQCEGKPNMDDTVKVLRASNYLGDQITSFFEEYGDDVYDMEFSITNYKGFQNLKPIKKHNIDTKWLKAACCSIEEIKKLNPSIEIETIESPVEEIKIEEPVEIAPKKVSKGINKKRLDYILLKCKDREYAETLTSSKIEELITTYSGKNNLSTDKRNALIIIRAIRRERGTD